MLVSILEIRYSKLGFHLDYLYLLFLRASTFEPQVSIPASTPTNEFLYQKVYCMHVN